MGAISNVLSNTATAASISGNGNDLALVATKCLWLFLWVFLQLFLWLFSIYQCVVSFVCDDEISYYDDEDEDYCVCDCVLICVFVFVIVSVCDDFSWQYVFYVDYSVLQTFTHHYHHYYPYY